MVQEYFWLNVNAIHATFKKGGKLRFVRFHIVLARSFFNIFFYLLCVSFSFSLVVSFIFCLDFFCHSPPAPP